MRSRRLYLSTVLVLSILLAACTSGGANSSQNMQATETAGAMMHATSTADRMMGETATAGAMIMHETPTADRMMGETATAGAMMMHETPTADQMMQETSTPDAMMSQATPTQDAMMQGTPTGAAMSGDSMAETPAWLSSQLTGVLDSKNFALSDYKGKVVLVEMMAVWCTTCKAQQAQIKLLLDKLGMPDNLVVVSLDIDPNEDAALLKNYVEQNHLGWTFAVAPKETAREISQLYGDQFLNPPSAPILIIDAHEHVYTLPFGLKSADDLQKPVEQYLSHIM